MLSFRPIPTKIQLAALALGLILPLAGFAEVSSESLFGAGLRSRPAYDGSASQRLDVVPVVRYFGQPWFIRSTQGVLEGGARLELAPGLHAGAQLAFEPGRDANESEFLKAHGIPDLKIGGSVGLHLEYDHKFGPMPVALLMRTRQHTDTDRGAQVDTRLTAGIFQNGPVSAGLFTQATWANDKATSASYAVTPQQSASSGLPAYTAGSGWLFTSVGLLWSVDLSKSWAVVGNLEARHLRGDAARSPLAERTSNYYSSASLTYQF
jgi:outer membrane scaffolding protein for murein synthesis (MipA/OmpV family)